jgi:glycosyltransferase involved in cell wall biosynthesis
VKLHEMGKIIPIGDAAALAEAALDILSRPQDYRRPAGPIAECYDPDRIAVEYENLFAALAREVGR